MVDSFYNGCIECDVLVGFASVYGYCSVCFNVVFIACLMFALIICFDFNAVFIARLHPESE